MLFPYEEYWKEKTSIFLQNKYWISVALFKENIYVSIPVIHLRVVRRGLLWSSMPCKNISYKLPVNNLTFPKLYLWRMHMTHSRTMSSEMFYEKNLRRAFLSWSIIVNFDCVLYWDCQKVERCFYDHNLRTTHLD